MKISMKLLVKMLSSIVVIIGCLIFCFQSTCFGANYPLELIHPKGNLLSGNHRICKAYPGIEYNIRAAAIGGEYPYKFSLSNAPSGMEIDSRTGEITWSNPQNSVNNITIKVTDSDGRSVEGSWSINVTNSGFRFMDAVNGRSQIQGGNGSYSNPWKSIDDFYNNASLGDIVYFREGVYTVNCDGDNWISINRCPKIWLGYPGEEAVIDFNFGPRMGINATVYFDNLTFKNALNVMFYVVSSHDNQVFRRLSCNNITYSSGSNPAFFRFERAGVGDYFILQDSKLTCADQKGMSVYWTNKMLIEDNRWEDFGHTMIDLKERAVQFTVRGNLFQNINRDGTAQVGCLNSGDGVKSSGELCYNYFKLPNKNAVVVPLDDSFSPSKIYFYRNTIDGDVVIRSLSADDGPYVFTRNVIVNNENSDDGNNTDHIYNRHQGPDYLIQRIDNLVGYPTDNIIDNNGKLQGTYRTQFLGMRGWEIGTAPPPPPPNPPSEATNFQLIDNQG